MRRVLGVLVVLGLAGCEPAEVAAWEEGERLAQEASLSTSRFNVYACTTCHATSEGETRLPPGAPLMGVARRPHFWGGAERTLLEAVNVCFTRFMQSPTPLTRESPEGRALYEYLVHLSPAEAQAWPFTVVRQVAEVPRGEAARGEAVWRAACQGCHGAVQTGEGRLGEDVVVLGDVLPLYAEQFPEATPALVVVEKVRFGRFFGLGGTMPPFSREALSDEDLGALLTFLGL